MYLCKALQSVWAMKYHHLNDCKNNNLTKTCLNAKSKFKGFMLRIVSLRPVLP